MITLVHDGPRILLTRAPHFPKGMYGLSAGFVEAGESLEACVHREVKEETGLTVTDVRYVASQPWPLPSQLMVGFFAKLTGGELTVDLAELEEAAFFDVDALPGLPPPASIARYLVDRYLEEHRGAR
jgi:NAD+ diphosphatase